MNRIQAINGIEVSIFWGSCCYAVGNVPKKDIPQHCDKMGEEDTLQLPLNICSSTEINTQVIRSARQIFRRSTKGGPYMDVPGHGVGKFRVHIWQWNIAILIKIIVNFQKPFENYRIFSENKVKYSKFENLSIIRLGWAKTPEIINFAKFLT